MICESSSVSVDLGYGCSVMRLGVLMVRPQRRYWLGLFGADIDELVGFEVSRVWLKTVNSSRETQGWINHFDWFGDCSWK